MLVILILIIILTSLVARAEDDDDLISISKFPSTPEVVYYAHPGTIVPNSFIVVMRPGVGNLNLAAESLISGAGLQVNSRFEYSLRGFAISCRSERVLEDLRAHPQIESIYEDGLVMLTPPPPTTTPSATPTGPNTWGISRIGGPQSSLRIGGGGNRDINVDIFLIDSGIAPHPDLNIGTLGRNFVADATGPGPALSTEDKNGHGTHVAGIAAAKDHGFGCVGSCPGARVHPVRVLDAAGCGQFSWVIAGINYVQSLKVSTPELRMVANVSLGSPIGKTGYNVLDMAMSRAISAGVPFTVAAGNSSADAASWSPAHVATAITVGSFGPDDIFSGFSNFGRQVSILAPGCEILSTHLNGGYALLSGTSMASPFVAGVVGLYLSKNPAAKPAVAKAAILHEAKKDLANPKIKGVPGNTVNTAVWMATM